MLPLSEFGSFSNLRNCIYLKHKNSLSPPLFILLLYLHSMFYSCLSFFLFSLSLSFNLLFDFRALSLSFSLPLFSFSFSLYCFNYHHHLSLPPFQLSTTSFNYHISLYIILYGLFGLPNISLSLSPLTLLLSQYPCSPLFQLYISRYHCLSLFRPLYISFTFFHHPFLSISLSFPFSSLPLSDSFIYLSLRSISLCISFLSLSFLLSFNPPHFPPPPPAHQGPV